LIPLEKIESAKHIVVLCDEESFANANVIYTYLLTLHKKVSLVSEEKLAKKYAFLPWYDKLRTTAPTSSDMFLESDTDTLSLFRFLQKHAIKINQKMATALYAGLMMQYNYCKRSDCDGMIFAAFSQLIELGAEYKICVKYLQNFEPLSLLRLKAILYANMRLHDNAREALVYICDEDLKRSGAGMKDAQRIMSDFLSIAHVQEVHLLKSDANNEIIKSIKEI
jgi:phosphoesterase RecJ-like protein